MSGQGTSGTTSACPRCGDDSGRRFCPTCGLDRTPDAPLPGIADALAARARETAWLSAPAPPPEPEHAEPPPVEPLGPPVEPMDVSPGPGGSFPPAGGTCQRCGATRQEGEWYCTGCGVRLQPGRFSLAREAADRSEAWAAANPGIAASWAAGVARVQEAQEAAREAVPAPEAGPATSEPGASATMKTCPECAEQVQAAARVCRFCGHRFDASPSGWSGTPTRPAYAAEAATTSVVAVVAFVCSLVGLWIAGIPLGIYARREIEESGGRLKGDGFATAAIAIGVLGALFTLLMLGVVCSSAPDMNEFEFQPYE